MAQPSSTLTSTSQLSGLKNQKSPELALRKGVGVQAGLAREAGPGRRHLELAAQEDQRRGRRGRRDIQRRAGEDGRRRRALRRRLGAGGEGVGVGGRRGGLAARLK